MKIYRHGDLLIIETNEKVPQTAVLRPHTRLLEGEVTGHHHTLDHPKAKVYEAPSKKEKYLIGYLSIPVETPLIHPEHKTIPLPPGTYKFYQQREYDEIEERRVID